MLKPIGLAFAIVALNFILSISAFSQSNAFTYQGKLNEGGIAANGTFSSRFALFPTEIGGNAVASLTPDISVFNGVFTVVLDFGSTAFDGSARFLEINIGGTTLTPRQPITSAPYAIRSSKAALADNAVLLDGVASRQYVQTGDARLADQRVASGINFGTAALSGIVPLANGGTGSATQNFVDLTTPQTIGGDKTFSNTVSGNVINAVSYNIGGSPVLRVTSPNASNTFLGILAGTATGPNQGFNSFFGNEAGRNWTEGGNNSFFGAGSGTNNGTGSDNSYFGRNAGFTVTGNNNSFFGSNAGGLAAVSGSNNTLLGASTTASSSLTFATAVGAGATVATSNTVVLGRLNDTVNVAGRLKVSNPGPGDSPACWDMVNHLLGTCGPGLIGPTSISVTRNIELANQKQQVLIEQLQKQIDALTKLVCTQNSDAEICKR